MQLTEGNMKTLGGIIIASLLAQPMGQAEDKVDQALKQGDLSTVMKMLEQGGQAAPEPAATSPGKAPGQPYSDDELHAIRTRLAEELRAAREEARVKRETGVATTSDTGASSEKPSAELLKKLGKAAPVTLPEGRTTTPPPARQAMPKPTPPPNRVDQASKRKANSLYERVFGNRKAGKAGPAVPPVKSYPLKTTLPAPNKPAPHGLNSIPRKAPAQIELAQAGLNPIKIKAPKAPGSTPAKPATVRPAVPGPVAVQPAPAIRVSQAPPRIRELGAGGARGVRQNRAALDSLIKQSRADIVKMAMNQASGGASTAKEVQDPDAWKKAGPNAWKYEGEWKDGNMHGQGRMQFADGWEYAGAFFMGTMHGQGTLVYPDTTVYEGQFKNGKMDGFGKLTYPDGWTFIGQWRDGHISGSGTLVNPGN